MSTTVKYKGNTIATLDNETKTLTTAGTWLEDDIEIVDVSSGSSQSLIVDTPDVNGGTIREITTDTVVMLEGAKTVTPSSTQQIITPSQGYDGFSSVVVEASSDVTMEEYFSKTGANISGDIVYNGTTLRPHVLRNNIYVTSFTGNNVTNCNGYNNSSGYPSPFANSSSVATFSGCSNITYISLPLVTNWNYCDNIFENCTSLESVNIDWMNVTNLATAMFKNCQSLTKTTYVIPKLISNVWVDWLTENSHITMLDIESANMSTNNLEIRATAFKNDSNLSTLIIRSNSKTRKLVNINAFQGTPFASDGTGGTLYVPQAVKSSYEFATNWSTILAYSNNEIKTIEGSIYETKYADGTTIPTQ